MEYCHPYNITNINLCPYHFRQLTQKSFYPQNQKFRGKSYFPRFIHVNNLQNSSINSVNLRQAKSTKLKKPAPYRYVTIVYSEKNNKINYVPNNQFFDRNNIILKTENYNLYENKNCTNLNNNILVEVDYESKPIKIPKTEKKIIRKKGKLKKINLEKLVREKEPKYIRKKDKFEKQNLGEITRESNREGLKLKNKKIIKNIEIRTSHFNTYGEDTTFSMTTNADEVEFTKRTKKKSKKNLVVD